MVATVALTPVGRAGGCSGAALCEHPEFLSSGSVQPLIPSFLTNILGPHVAGGAWPRAMGSCLGCSAVLSLGLGASLCTQPLLLLHSGVFSSAV